MRNRFNSNLPSIVEEIAYIRCFTKRKPSSTHIIHPIFGIFQPSIAVENILSDDARSDRKIVVIGAKLVEKIHNAYPRTCTYIEVELMLCKFMSTFSFHSEVMPISFDEMKFITKHFRWHGSTIFTNEMIPKSFIDHEVPIELPYNHF